MQTAFVLGAGLGTRLRPLTDHLPKPLVPVRGRPLITYAFEHLLPLGVQRFIVNTHHCPDAYQQVFPDAAYRGTPIEFVFEPALLETGGGIANIVPRLDPSEHLVVYNGDILTDLPLAQARDAHLASGRAATLVLRREHPEKRIAFDPATGTVLDLKGTLQTGHPHEHGLTGIYFLAPGFFPRLPAVSKFSVRDTFLDLIRDNHQLGGVDAPDGLWADLGDRDAYLDAHRTELPQVAADATVHPTATLTGNTHIGSGASVDAGAVLTDTVLWPGAHVDAGANLTRCIVRTGQTASGTATSHDF